MSRERRLFNVVFDLHTFLFADLVGFTRFTAMHGDERAAEAAVRFHERVGELAASHGCELIKTIGDGVMVRARNSESAVELGRRVLALQRDEGMPARVGIDTGPAVPRGGDWFGSTVNTAARVVARAQAGELLMTERTRAASAGVLEGAPRERGRRRLRGLPVQALFGDPQPAESISATSST
jgi:adenylate cyclase